MRDSLNNVILPFPCISLSEDKVDSGNKIVIFILESNGIVAVRLSGLLGCVVVLINHDAVVRVNEFDLWDTSYNRSGVRLSSKKMVCQIVFDRCWNRFQSLESFEIWFALLRLFKYRISN